ncbi:MAG: class I SAM-dependent methyltransferase [Eubacteriales bacterium]|nr:class I SAM-dependent methyltransferase [Eubacteriales bacterium]
MAKVVERAVNTLLPYIRHQDILEIGCGAGEFSLAAVKYANSVTCIDLDAFRLHPDLINNSQIHFQVMDARKTSFQNEQFDTIVAYNAIGHLAENLKNILRESLRIVKNTGCVIFISTFKMDRPVIQNDLQDLCKEFELSSELLQQDPFLIGFIKKP